MNEANSSALISQYKGWRNSYTSGSSARETAYQMIRSKIINMDYKPGEALSDKKVAEELQMSRTPVREAIIILTTTNMVVLKPQIGTFVSPINTEWIEMERFSRFATEKEILIQACKCANDETAWAYEQNMREYEHYCNTDEPDRAQHLLQIDNEFHAIAFKTVGRQNSFFHMMNEMQHFERLRMLSLMKLRPINNGLASDHKEICDAVMSGNALQAEAAIEKHLSRYHEDLQMIREEYPNYF